jgi:RNA polymerase sigma-70 factor (ECF subfamily)
MDETSFLTEQFEAERPRLRAVAYRMLGSLSDADDAVQEAWLRLRRTNADEIENLGGWLTTVVARISLNMLRARAAHREEPYEPHIADPVVTEPDGADDPAAQALLGDAVELALLLVLDALAPAERLAFVLHDVFAVPFDEIAPIVQRSPEATRQLASRARRRVRGTRDDEPDTDADPARRRAVVDAFLRAGREGDLDGLVAVLDPDVVLRADMGTGPLQVVRGAEQVAARARMFAGRADAVRTVLVNGEPGVVSWAGGRPLSVLAFTVRGGRIVAITSLGDADRLAALGL